MTLLASVGPWQVLFLSFFLLGLVLPVLALIQVIRNSFPGNEKLIWVLAIIFFPILGAFLYFVIGRRRIIRN